MMTGQERTRVVGHECTRPGGEMRGRRPEDRRETGILQGRRGSKVKGKTEREKAGGGGGGGGAYVVP